jgi:predicted nucleotidyltransferase
MPPRFEPKTAILPPAQRKLWPQLATTSTLSFVLYGGTAVALHLGHRQSLDFDFFGANTLEKKKIDDSFSFMSGAQIIQEEPNTLAVAADIGGTSVRISFFGAIGIGHVNEPLLTSDGVLLVASREDLLATKLKAILDRAEAKDYIDIAALLAAGVSLSRGLGAFTAMYKSDAVLPLKALGHFKDGDLPSLPAKEQELLRTTRDRISEIPTISLRPGLLG